MVDNFNRQILRVAVAQICQSMGWDALQKSTHDTLTDVMQRYLEEIGKVAYSYTQLCNRTKPNLDDLHLAFQDTGVVLQELENFVAQVDPLQFIHPFTKYPKCQPCRLQHPSEGEIVDRMEFYSEHLPPLPITYQEPTGEKEEPPSTESATVAEETEKIKSAPLKESNNVMESSENGALKRLHDGGVRSSKRPRLDIPANLILDKKENIENTDGDSLSPATPVSPYLPQDLPKLPEESAKPSSFTKAKTEHKPLMPASIKKEMVLPIQKVTPPEKKTKIETSPSSKKPKVKKEKSISPTVQNILRSPSPKTELLSPVKKLSASKNSPSPKKKSPMNVKSPIVEKQVHVVKKSPSKGSENKTPSRINKISPVKDLPSNVIAMKKSPSIVEVKKVAGSPKVKEREFKSIKKKKMIKEEANRGKSSQDEEKTTGSLNINTPKLMIKLLPKSGEAGESTKSSPVAQKTSTTAVKVKTEGSSLSIKTLSIKAKASDSESVVRSEKKLKLTSESLEIGVIKKEHSKKKKKKKDKDKDKEKGNRKEKRKSDKSEPPIPKFRFKLDPSGESKTGETTMSSSSKSATSSGQSSSSKKSSTIVIETEKVRSSVFTETLSSVLDYDPNRAYFCPVCHKQDDGSPMVGCDGCDEWCHWSCVGLMAAPPETEKWYCPLCLLKKEKSKKGKSKKKS